MELGVAAGTERLRDVTLRSSGLTMERLLESPPLRGESNDAGAAVVRIGLTVQVAPRFEMAQQVVDRLLRDLELVSEFGRSAAVEAGITEEADVRRVHILVARREDTVEHLTPHRLPGVPHHRADVWAFLQELA